MATIILMVAELPGVAAAPIPGSAVPAALAAEERESCTRNLKVIYDAIQAYQFDHKDLPNWLSDLVPGYLSDGNVLICPVCRRTGRTEAPPLADPKLACSYIFEFSPVPVAKALPGEARHTRREWKRRQMGLVGSAVPIVRCRNHSPILNLGFNGSIYASPTEWELMFTNRIRAAELSVGAIFGGEQVEATPAATVASASPPPKPVPTSSKGTPENFIDLSSFYNSPLDKAWLGIADDDLALLPSGMQKLGGIDFDIRGLIQLKGKSAALSKFPSEIKGIPVHQRCQHLYFLHAASTNGTAEEGEQIGTYIVHLPNNQLTLDIPIYYGRSVRSWHEELNEPEAEKELKVAWTGENTATKRTGKRVRLFVTAWNLAPGVEIESLDFLSNVQNAAPLLLGISYD